MSLPLPSSLLELMSIQIRQNALLRRNALAGALPSPSRHARYNEIFRRHAHALALKAAPDVRERAGNRFAVEYRESNRHVLEGRPAWLPKDLDISHKSPAAILREHVENLISQPISEADPFNVSEPTYTEEDLQALYANLLAHADNMEQLSLTAPKTEDNIKVTQGVAHRLLASTSQFEEEHSAPETSTASLSSRLFARLSTSAANVPKTEVSLPLDRSKVWHAVLARLTDIVESLEKAPKLTQEPSQALPISLLSPREWSALIQLFIEEENMVLAEHTLELIKRSGAIVPEELWNEVLNTYAKRGDVPAVETFLKRFSEGKPTERQRDLHIKAHLKSPTPEYNLDTALATLHSYESLALLPPIPSYTRLITALFSARSTQAHAQAWDLFAHMRYVAHPKPDPLLYALMIRACAGTGPSHSGYLAEPERALDLWTEMRNDAKYVPTVGAYNAIILVCARSKDYVTEAFRLAKEMLDSHRDAFGNPLMKPTRETFCALLVAAKTRGDLPRARWILAEMLKFQQQEDEVVNAIDEEAMMHVFHAYASYRPPFRRQDTKIVENSQSEMEASSKTDIVKESPSETRFSVTPPQTRGEVIAEAKTLFERIIEDSKHGQAGEEATKGSFSRVILSARLLNSYLSVHYNQGSLKDAKALFSDLFARLNVKKTPRTYIEVLERCAISEGAQDREVARIFSDELWMEWLEVEDTLSARGSDARLIERAHRARIRIYALFGQLDRAMSHVRAFVRRYPPYTVSHVTPKSAMRSTRTVLFAPRPLVRLVSHTEVPDDTVTPILTFRDLELLHHRLIDDGLSRRYDLAFIKYICKAYEGALRRRRDQTIRT